MEPELVTISEIKKIYPGSFIDDDLLLFNEVSDLPKRDSPFRLASLFVAVCLKGTVHYVVDTLERTVKAGDLIIISSGQVINEYWTSDDCEGMALTISEDFFREVVSGVHELSTLFLFSRSHPVFYLRDRQVENVKHYFDLIKNRVDDPNQHFRRHVAGNLMRALIYEVSNIIWELHENGEVIHSRSEKIFTDFIRLVEQRFRDERRVGWYASQLCISPKYLSEIVRQVSRRTPNEWIDSYVIMEMRVQLKNTSKSIKELTKELHFPNQSFLGKYFKEHVGISPSDYRRREVQTVRR